ncbi:MAG: tetratricopeptide repeat protein [Bryobacterales bacterium]|nr:tetratricopeptide repeat protein [Bryobacterales bacterium]
MHGWTIELLALPGGDTREAMPWGNGAFEFRGVTPGEYRLSVRDAGGHVLHEEAVSLHRMDETLAITVRADKLPQGRPADPISIQQLQHTPPRKAMKAWRIAKSALEKRQIDRAVDHLKAAIAVDPAFADAYNDLGTAYFHLNRYEQSAEHFQKAIDLAPTHRQATDNLCLVLIKSGRYAEAGQAAGRILKRGGGSAMVHYAAALGLISESGSPIETMNHLRAAQGQIPNAHLTAARILANAGRRAEAARDVEAYLRAKSGSARRAELEAWLAELRK